jgi:hypothetical protein
MRASVGAVAAAMLGLVVSGAATLVGDRMTFVPPPDVRVEAFLRQLMTRRAELALKYLSRDLRTDVSPSMLQHYFDAIEQQIGEIENVNTQTLSWDRRSAAARAELIASNRTRLPLEFGLTWESGAWAISDLPRELRPVASGSVNRGGFRLCPSCPLCLDLESNRATLPALPALPDPPNLPDPMCSEQHRPFSGSRLA